MTPSVAIVPALAIGVAWILWLVSWLAAAAWSRRTLARPGYARELPNRLVTVLGGVLLFMSLGSSRTYIPISWQPSELFSWSMFACVLGGMAFAWWARLHLGPLWSGTVTRKAEHRIVDTGPYAIVRHPIYTGLLFSLYATALERGRLEPILGVALLTVGLWMKARLEESFLAQDLPGYDQYRARVPMLVPLLKGAA